ncbi:MAG: hypothetical protein HY814_08590 [Candidatus Riflebacteria bacterium]|nr:hypothetical protein [Candidatus Riflebacteria bacterium]
MAAWLVGMPDGAADDSTRKANFELLYSAPIRTLAPPSPRFDPDGQHQQFLTSGVLLDVRTVVLNGPGIRRRLVQGMARNTSQTTFPRASLELLEARVTGRTAAGQPIPGVYEVVTSQFLGDLAPGRSTVVSLPFQRPDTLLRVYQLRLRTLP